MNFNDLLALKEIDPKEVIVFRHRPPELELRKVLPLLAAEKPELFNAYQQTQGARVEKALRGARYVASFIGHEPQRAVFVGLYTIGGIRRLTLETYWQEPALMELGRFGMKGFTADESRDSILWFDMSLMDFYRDWTGRLIIRWPGPELSWWRRAHRNEFPVHAVREESVLNEAMPSWDEMEFGWLELQVLPKKWRDALAQWRGVYFIFDISDGKGYVGSAYGAENIMGRWLQYSNSGHGGNRQLRTRDPLNFRFTILQRVSPDLSADEVIRLETSWKTRLHTRAGYGLNDN